jgi:hypothetical protein
MTPNLIRLHLDDAYREGGLEGLMFQHTMFVNACLRQHRWDDAKAAVKVYDQFWEDHHDENSEL